MSTRALRWFMRDINEKLYFLSGFTITEYNAIPSSLVNKEDMTKLWHMRLGHISKKGMKILLKRDLLYGHKV